MVEEANPLESLKAGYWGRITTDVTVEFCMIRSAERDALCVNPSLRDTLSCHIIISAKLKARLLLFPKAQD